MIKYLSYICILLLIVIVWRVRYQVVVAFYEPFFHRERVSIRGFVTSQPYLKISKQVFRISAFEIETDQFPRYQYGDYLVVSGKLEKMVTDSPIRRLRLINPSIRVLTEKQSRREGLFLRVNRSLQVFRQKLMQQFNRFLPEPQASLLIGITLGVRRSLPNHFFEALRDTGTLHVVVASGYNVTVIAGVISYFVLILLPRKIGIPFVIVGIVAYTMLAGADPPVLRAAFMGGLVFLAQFFGRSYEGLWALFISSVLMLFLWPLLLFDVGFQLSMAATAGILTLTPALVRFFRTRVRIATYFAEELSVTLGAQLMVLPLLLYHFQQVSWLSPIVNLLVAPLVPLLMGFGGALLIFSFLSSLTGQIVALFAWVPLSVFIWIVELFHRLPLGTFKVRAFRFWLVGGFYLVVFALIRKYNRKKAFHSRNRHI